MRVMIRFSLARDPKNALRNELKRTLELGGIKWAGSLTAIFEGYITERDLATTMGLFWDAVRRHQPARISHFWMYADSKRAPVALPG